MKRILIVLILLVFQSFAYKSSFDTVAMNRIILKRADTSITPAMFLMKDSANDTVKFLPYSSVTTSYLRPGVTPGTLPIAATDSTFSNSPIYKTGKVLNVFKYDSSYVDADTFIDGFTRTENPLDSGWHNVNGLASKFYTSAGSALTTGQAISVHTTGSFGSNQYSWANGGTTAGVCVRTDTSGNGYVFINTFGIRAFLFKRVAGIFTKIDSSASTITSDQFLWVTVVGDTIKCYTWSSGALPPPCITRYDTTFRSGGYPGIYGTSATSINSWKGYGIGGMSRTYSDSALKVNGMLRVGNVPSSSSDTALVKDGDTVALRAISTFDVDSAEHLKTDGNGQLLYSNNGVADTSSIKYDSSSGVTTFPAEIYERDSNSTVPARFGAGHTENDVDKDSSAVFISASGQAEAGRNGYLFAAGNEWAGGGGETQLSSGDSGWLRLTSYKAATINTLGDQDSNELRIYDIRDAGINDYAIALSGPDTTMGLKIVMPGKTASTAYFKGDTAWANILKTSWLFATKAKFSPGSDSITIDSSGSLHMYNNATVWDDEKIVATALDYIGTGDPEVITWELGTFDGLLRIFQSGDKAYFTCQFSHHRKSGSGVYAHIHWTPHDRGNEENGNTVSWRLGYTWSSIDSIFPSIDTISLSDTCSGTDNRHQMTKEVLIAGTGKGTSSILSGFVERASGDTWVGTTAAQSPGFLEIDFHYEIDKLGSKNPSSD